MEKVGMISNDDVMLFDMKSRLVARKHVFSVSHELRIPLLTSWYVTLWHWAGHRIIAGFGNHVSFGASPWPLPPPCTEVMSQSALKSLASKSRECFWQMRCTLEASRIRDVIICDCMFAFHLRSRFFWMFLIFHMVFLVLLQLLFWLSFGCGCCCGCCGHAWVFIVIAVAVVHVIAFVAVLVLLSSFFIVFCVFVLAVVVSCCLGSGGCDNCSISKILQQER